SAEESAQDSPQSGGGEGTEVTLPALGESVTEGTVTRWLKAVGDSVEVDEALLEVSTDKVDTEIPSPVAGTLQKIVVDEDETVGVGAVPALVGSGAPPAKQAEPEAAKAPEPVGAPEPAPTEKAEPAAEKPAPAESPAPAPAASSPAPAPAAEKPAP